MARRRCGGFFHSFENILLIMTIASVITGVAIGFLLRPLELSEDTQRLINFPGEIFMQVLKMMILPLIFASLICALAQMDAKESGRMGLATVLYYSTTTILSTITGIVLVLSIHPGDPTIKESYSGTAEESDISTLDTLLDAVRNMFPKNIIQATFQRVQTEYIKELRPSVKLAGNFSVALPYVLTKTIKPAAGTNILGVIMFCTGFGIVISKLGEKAQIIVEFFIILDTIIMRLINWLMVLMPIGIVSLIAGNVLELEDLSDTAEVLFLYIVTVLCGLIFHTVFTMPMLYFLVTRRNPLRIMRGMLQAIVTGFGTASGGAALPISMRCMEEKLGVDRRITRFVLPLGATINMDGNALYEAVAVIFIAQLNNVTLSMAEVITVSVTATLASLGLNSAPAGLISILLILGTLGLPVQDVSLIITVDWLLDRVKAAVNVLGDAYAADAVSCYLTRNAKHAKDSPFQKTVRAEIDQLEHPQRCPLLIINSEPASHHVNNFDVETDYSRRASAADDLAWDWRRRLSTITPNTTPPRKPSEPPPIVNV